MNYYGLKYKAVFSSAKDKDSGDMGILCALILFISFVTVRSLSTSTLARLWVKERSIHIGIKATRGEVANDLAANVFYSHQARWKSLGLFLWCQRKTKVIWKYRSAAVQVEDIG